MMHIELLIEDLSGKKTLDTILPKMIFDPHTFIVHAYKGLGRIPTNMKDASDPSKRILLTNLPKLLKGYGRTFKGYGSDYKAAVVLVCDLDDRSVELFQEEFAAILNSCNPKPEARFCLAIEEGEAWLLGDLSAINDAYPTADRDVLDSYVNDSICGTWETLADAVYDGGAKALIRKGWQTVGAEKSRWATEISPRMALDNNESPSFQSFRNEITLLQALKSFNKTARS